VGHQYSTMMIMMIDNSIMMMITLLLCSSLMMIVNGFTTQPFVFKNPTLSQHHQPHHHQHQQQQQRWHTTPRRIMMALLDDNNNDEDDDDSSSSATTTTTESSSTLPPQVWSNGHSSAVDVLEAIQEATEMAIAGLPADVREVSIGIVSVSSLYDTSPSLVVPTVLSCAQGKFVTVPELIGCTVSGYVSSTRNEQYGLLSTNTNNSEADTTTTMMMSACVGLESEGIPGVAITLAALPDVTVKTFHVTSDDVMDDIGRLPAEIWNGAIGLGGFGSTTTAADLSSGDDETQNNNKEPPPPPVFMLLSSPTFSQTIDELVLGLTTYFPGAQLMGGVASMVSSLSRPRLFRYSEDTSSSDSTTTALAGGCVGVALQGDLTCQTLVAPGTKPVGGIYRIVTGNDRTIRAIVLDEEATNNMSLSQEEEEDDDDDDDDEQQQTKAQQLAFAYAKARIPKPVLAEANFVMRTLSDDDQAAMRSTILMGVERPTTTTTTTNELQRLQEGQGHRWKVTKVGSANMKDGSVTLPLNDNQDLQPGLRVRFFVRDASFSKSENQALWTGYKKVQLTETLLLGGGSIEPTAAFCWSTQDRGAKYFGIPSYESRTLTEFLPNVGCVSGFFANGVIGRLDQHDEQPPQVFGSATTYALLRPVRGDRPRYTPAMKRAEHNENNNTDDDESTTTASTTTTTTTNTKAAPRDPDTGELIWKRREVHSGRALTVSTVEWSVADKAAVPTSVLEGFLWDKETEVDRFRERVPLSNLVSQSRNNNAAFTTTRPWTKGIIEKYNNNKKKKLVLIPECKRQDPASTTVLHGRYNAKTLAKSFIDYIGNDDVPALSVNCDAVLFGGTLEDVTQVREMNDNNDNNDAVPPVLASDLILYPYQLYKLQMAGADAVTLVAGALTNKDFLYLTKIASSLRLQCIVSVTSEYQLRLLLSSKLGSNSSIHGIIVSNRNLEDYSIDDSGQQALDLLRSSALQDVKDYFGNDADDDDDTNLLPILVEGRVGVITYGDGGTTESYLQALEEAGATGAIVASAISEGGRRRGDTNNDDDDDDDPLALLTR